MVLFQNAIIREVLLKNQGKLPTLDSENKEIKEIKENKENKELNNLSPKTKKVEEHRMNRDKSVENFIKWSWSWTL
jgi:hypothetical protein